MIKVMRYMLDFFLSLRTAIWLLFGLIFILLYGAVVMPRHEEFQALHVTPLFAWMAETPSSITWWLWAALVILTLMTANTLFCSFESLIRKREARHWLLIISPQVMHAGFLFILLAHLLSSYSGFKATTFVVQGSAIPLPNGDVVLFEAVRSDMDISGYVTDFSADIRYFRNGRETGADRISSNNPSIRDGMGIYIKTVRPMPVPSALIEVSREPGAIPALIGGVLFLVGMATLLIFKIRREEARG